MIAHGTILGIDQGSTKTVAIVADRQGRILGKGLSYGACHFYDGMPKAMQAVEEAASKALKEAGFKTESIGYTCGGMAGANFPPEFEALEAGLRDLFHGTKVRVYNDCLPAMRAGSSSPWSGVICAGTGLNAALCGPEGILTVYNNYIDDRDQGAGGLGRRALEAIFQAEIGCIPPTLLAGKALDIFGLESVEKLLLAYQRHQLVKPLKEICPVLFETAAQADRAALGVISEFGRSVSRYIVAGILKYGLQDKEMELVLAGGVFKARSSLLFDTIRAQIHRVAPKTKVLYAACEPVVGAVLFVLDELHGRPLPGTVAGNCRKSALEMGLASNIAER